MSVEEQMRLRIAMLHFLMIFGVVLLLVPSFLPFVCSSALLVVVMDLLRFRTTPGPKLMQCIYKSSAHDSFSNRNLFRGKC